MQNSTVYIDFQLPGSYMFRHYLIVTRTVILNKPCTIINTTNVRLFLKYLFLYILLTFWRELTEDGDNAETRRRQVIERMYNIDCRIVHFFALSEF